MAELPDQAEPPRGEIAAAAPPVAATALERAGEMAGLGFWRRDLVHQRFTFSAEVFRILGRDPASMSLDAGGFYDVFHPNDRDWYESTVKAAMAAGEPYQCSVRVLRPDGGVRQILATGQPQIDGSGRLVAYIGLVQDITEMVEMRQEAARARWQTQLLQKAIEVLPDLFYVKDLEHHFLVANMALARQVGAASVESVIGKTDADFHEPHLACLYRQHEAAVFAGEEAAPIEELARREDGTLAWFLSLKVPLRDAEGNIIGLVGLGRDITEEKRADEQARAHAEKLARLAEEVARSKTEAERMRDLLVEAAAVASDGFALFDPDDRLILCNEALAATFGAPPAELVGQRFADMLRRPNFRKGMPLNDEDFEVWLQHRLETHLAATGVPSDLQWGGRWFLLQERRTRDGSTVLSRIEITHLKQVEDDLRRLAGRDGLTGLANRPTLLAALAAELASLSRDPTSGGTLMLFDIDHFKQINDTLGHDAGDALLIEIGARLSQRLRPRDVAARLGGDEFAVLMPGLSVARVVKDRVGQLQAALSEPFSLAGRSLTVTISAGATTYPEDGVESSGLLKNADLALYEAKRAGRARWHMYRPEQTAAHERHLRVVEGLRSAIAGGALTVALQPKRKMRGGHDGFEALARWHDGTRWVPPLEFIPAAEEAGLIVPVGRAVLHETMARIRALRDRGFDPGRVAVNVSGAQLLDDCFIVDTLQMLANYDLGPDDLELEITETVLLGRAAARVDQVLRELSRLGVTLALDDFGTGFASLAHLSRLPIHRLKIDRSFVSEIGSGRGGVITRTVIGLARSLGMESVAEGVETADQLDFLQSEGCDAFQGYLFSRPLASLEEAANYMSDQSGAARLAPRLPSAAVGARM